MKSNQERLLTAILSTATIALFSTVAVAEELNTYYSSDFVETSATTSNQLAGVESRSVSEWGWGVGGEYADATETESVYQQEKNAYQVKVDQLNLTLEQKDGNLGDTQRITRRIPFTQF